MIPAAPDTNSNAAAKGRAGGGSPPDLLFILNQLDTMLDNDTRAVNGIISSLEQVMKLQKIVIDLNEDLRELKDRVEAMESDVMYLYAHKTDIKLKERW